MTRELAPGIMRRPIGEECDPGRQFSDRVVLRPDCRYEGFLFQSVENSRLGVALPGTADLAERFVEKLVHPHSVGPHLGLMELDLEGSQLLE